LAACAVALGCAGGAAGRDSAVPEAATVKVETTQARTEKLPREITLTGSIKANMESMVAANANGRVTRTYVERGSVVKKGDILVRLDTRASQAAATQEVAELDRTNLAKELSDSQCERNRDLFARQVITQEEHERTESACRQADKALAAQTARVRQARVSVEDGVIRAPIDGIVDQRYVNVGEYVSPNTVVAHVVQVSPLRLELTAGETDAGTVQPGQKVSFQVKALGDQLFEATVTYVAPALRDRSRDLLFDAVTDNADGVLKPGMFATARLETGTEDAVVIPASAAWRTGDTFRAFVVAGGRLEERILQARESDEAIVVLRGLASGETVVVGDVTRLRDGQRVL